MQNNEDKVTLIKDLYELKSFIEQIPNEKFDSYLSRSSDEFYLKVASLVRDQKLIEDIIESPSKEAVMLCLSTYIHGKPMPEQKKEIKANISETISQKIAFGTAKEFKKTAIIMPLSKTQIVEQLRVLYK